MFFSSPSTHRHELDFPIMLSTCALQQPLPLPSPFLLHKFPSLGCTFLLLFCIVKRYFWHLLLIFWCVPRFHWLQFSATSTPLIILSVDPYSFPQSLLDHVSHSLHIYSKRMIFSVMIGLKIEISWLRKKLGLCYFFTLKVSCLFLFNG